MEKLGSKFHKLLHAFFWWHLCWLSEKRERRVLGSCQHSQPSVPATTARLFLPSFIYYNSKSMLLGSIQHQLMQHQGGIFHWHSWVKRSSTDNWLPCLEQRFAQFQILILQIGVILALIQRPPSRKGMKKAVKSFMSLWEVPTWNLLLLYKTSGEAARLPLLVSCCLSSFLLIPEATAIHSCPEGGNNTGPKWHIAEAANIHVLWQLGIRDS